MTHIECDYHIFLNGQERDVRIVGRCVRQVDMGVRCEVERVLYEGRDILGEIPEAEMAPMRSRLACQHIAQAHPYGDSIEAAV